MKHDKIIVLDFGGQYNQLIVRRIREHHVYSELHSCTKPIDSWFDDSVKGIILTGGPQSVYAKDSLTTSEKIFDLGVPILGICYGMQWINYKKGGKIIKMEHSEFGRTDLEVDENPLFKGVPRESVIWMNHNDGVGELGEGLETIARTKDCPVAAYYDPKNKIWGVQFHPEVSHSEYGSQMLANFAIEICGCDDSWNMDDLAGKLIAQIKEVVGDKKVLCGLSGGVDSSVAATLVSKACGDQLVCIFVDHGLLRKDEADSVMETYKQLNLNVIKVDAKERFLSKLKGVSDPEQKRKIIGTEFIRVFEEESAKLGKYDYLVQGTIYPDVIESGMGNASLIKSHHNVGGLPDDVEFQLIEPLNLLFKDEVRKLGLCLGIPEDMVYRQPFPGPGLGIRVMGEITEEKLRIVRETDAILREEVKNFGLQRDIWQYFTVFTPVKTVGVKGDARAYDYVVAVRAVASTDAMTVEAYNMPYELLIRLSNRMVNEVDGVSRVVYDITSKPPGTIEWE